MTNKAPQSEVILRYRQSEDFYIGINTLVIAPARSYRGSESSLYHVIVISWSGMLKSNLGTLSLDHEWHLFSWIYFENGLMPSVIMRRGYFKQHDECHQRSLSCLIHFIKAHSHDMIVV